MFKRFRKKPVEVLAAQWFKNGDHPEDRCETINVLGSYEPIRTEGKVVSPGVPGVMQNKFCEECGVPFHKHGWIKTLEGGHIVCPSDWIITGVEGERYPCKDRIFKATYEEISDTEPYGPTGFGERHEAHRYQQIHAQVSKMGGWANFKHYVNNTFVNEATKYRAMEDQVETLKKEKEDLIEKGTLILAAAGTICKKAGYTNTECVDAVNLLVLAENLEKEIGNEKSS